MKSKVKGWIKFHLKNYTKTCQLKQKVPILNWTGPFLYLPTFVAIIPENIKREVLQEISRFLESNLS